MCQRWQPANHFSAHAGRSTHDTATSSASVVKRRYSPVLISDRAHTSFRSPQPQGIPPWQGQVGA